MSSPSETEEKLIQDVVVAVRRAMAHARKEGATEAIHRIVSLASDEDTTAGALSALPKPPPPPRALGALPGGPKVAGPRKYPYGFVTANITRALSDNPQGLSREGIRAYCADVLGAEIDEAAVRNTVKQLVKQKKAVRNPDGLYVPGPELQAA